MEVTRYRYDKRANKGSRRSRIAALLIAVLLFLGISSYSFVALAKEIPSQEASLVSLQATVPETVSFPWPSRGQAAIGSLEGGLLASSSEAETARPIASMAKVITALTVLEKLPLAVGEQGASYTMSASDVAIYNSYVAKLGSVMAVREGQVITQYQALQAMLLPSANNIADSLVLKVFGSMDAYTTQANQLVKTFGMEHTVVTDASGFSPGTLSTPSDMVTLARKLLATPVLAEIVAQQEAIIPGSGVIKNTNRLLTNTDIIGIKTGTTDEAGSCLLFAGRHVIEGQTVVIVGVIMGQTNWSGLAQNVRALLDATYQGFGMIEVVKAGETLGTYEAPWGGRTNIVAESGLSVLGWKANSLQPETEIRSIEAPIPSGTDVGTIRIKDQPQYEVKLVTDQELQRPSIWWRLTHYW